MLIRDRFDLDEIERLAPQVHNLILGERLLTPRNTTYIKNLLGRHDFFIALDRDEKVAGFVARERLVDNYYEIKCWYTAPVYRKTGLAYQLLQEAIQQKGFTYIGVTFQDSIIQGVRSYGFEPISLTKLPPKVLVRYLLTRQYSSIWEHCFRKKSTLLIKR